MQVKNLLNWVEFNLEHYKPSTYRTMLVNAAKDSYDMYVNNKIISNISIGNKSLPSPQDVRESFDEIVSNYLKGAAFNDENYETIVDDLMLAVDENNIKLLEKSV
jgi:hypothetical protein